MTLFFCPGQLAVEQQIIGELRKACDQQKPQAIFGRIAGIMDTFRQQKAVDGEGQPTNDPQPLKLREKDSTDVVDEHGHAGKKLQPFLGNACLLSHA